MSRLIARILLALSIWPLASLVYLVLFFVIEDGRRYPTEKTTVFLWSGVFTWVFMAGYWLLLWWGSVRWTGERSSLTVFAALGAAMAGTVLGAMAGSMVHRNFGYFIGSMAAPILWLVTTIFIWRESAAERSARVSAIRRDSIVCPTCGYNLTGLKESRCPECGTQFTLDELLAAQGPPTLEG
jgi:hypothetical protein